MNKKQIENEKLRLMVFESAKELGEKVDKHLLDRYGIDSNEYTFIVPIRENFFSDGHLKVEIDETVRGKNLFLLTDIGNYSITYKMHELINHASPNDLMAQLKDGIGASNCHAANINIIMPLLYAGRQHRRNTRENLMCGMALREIDSINRIKSLITFDVHDQGVEHAIHNMEFDNFYATNTILEQFIDDLSIDELRNLVFVAPDNGATGRRNVYLNSFNSDYINKEAGSFYKERNYNTLVNGKYPVVKHEYSGNQNLEGKTAIVIDDMISSGGSMFDVINSLKERNVSHLYIITTFALFTNGIDKFDEYYNNNMFDGVYTTNLSYIPKSYQEKTWLHVCDCSNMIAEIVYDLHNDLSISELLKDKSGPIKMLEKKFNNNKKD
ncbi:MAG: ribose-phosphate diphosphokinase [Bacilli bacterium]|nr:ribose-phosphate diphosphokinase [Bacilli bacterium]